MLGSDLHADLEIYSIPHLQCFNNSIWIIISQKYVDITSFPTYVCYSFDSFLGFGIGIRFKSKTVQAALKYIIADDNINM